MEDALEYDHDEVIQTRGSLSKLEEIVLAHATRISDIKMMMRENAATMRENISNVAALRDIVDNTSTQVKTVAEALREVTETVNNAFCLASGAQPTIIGHDVKLDALVDDVSKMSSDIDGLCASYASPIDHTTQLAQLEGTVSRIDLEFVELRKLLEKQSGSKMAGDSRTLPTTDTSASPDYVGLDRAQRKSPHEMDGSRDATVQANLASTHMFHDVHPLFPNADPAYRTPCEPQVTERAQTTTHQDEFNSSHAEEEGSTGGILPPRQAAQGSWPPNLESRRSPFRQGPPPRNSYQATSNAPPLRIGNARQHMDDS